MIWSIPDNLNIGFEVDIISNPDFCEFCCEHNCDSYITQFGGIKIEGVYVLKHNYLEIYQLVKHYIVYDGNYYIDVTPFSDDRIKNWFIPLKIKNYNCFVDSLERLESIDFTPKLYYSIYFSNQQHDVQILSHATPILNINNGVIIASNVTDEKIAKRIKNALTR